MIAGMLMFISFPAIVSQWVALDSLAVSSRNAAFGDQRVKNIAKTGSGCQAYFQGNCPVFLNKVRREQGVMASLGFSLVCCFIVWVGIGEVFIHSLELVLRNEVKILRDNAFRKSCNL